jgi:tryptophanyl-tRNA synthetase
MIHIGNFLGAIKNWVRTQDECDNIFCLVDLHAITVPHDPEALRAKTREAAAILFAAGLDPDKSAVYAQSQIPAHCELAWILNCVATMGQMYRMTQFKEKSAELKEGATVGLFTYPNLMAADILLYQADYVPVGSDQKQHVELTRDLAQRFNLTYGQTFKIPQPVISEVGARIMGLDDATRKMSKSVTNPNHAVAVLDPADVVMRKFRAAKTDTLREIRFDEARPEMFNLLTIYQAVTGEARATIEARFEGQGYGAFKKALAEVVIESLRPLQARYHEFAADPAALDALLWKSADHLRPIAEQTMTTVMDRMGIGIGRRRG